MVSIDILGFGESGFLAKKEIEKAFSDFPEAVMIVEHKRTDVTLMGDNIPLIRINGISGGRRQRAESLVEKVFPGVRIETVSLSRACLSKNR